MMNTMKGMNKMTPESLLREWYGRNMLARMRFHVDIPDDMEPIIIERNAYGMITTMNYSHSYNSLVRHDMMIVLLMEQTVNDSIIMYPLYALNKDNNEWTWIPDADDENIDADDTMLIMKSLKTDADISVQDTRVNGFTENWFETNSYSMTHDDNVFIIIIDDGTQYITNSMPEHVNNEYMITTDNEMIHVPETHVKRIIEIR